ncbi:MAG: nucleotidyl transferase AbiEii/AbiGii toxin family protein [Candidatus Aminicenantes bacterium]|nr:MAG: nucleotidyl transferase AbiEii/AbiGii toxin family protein [Candidatus Aminicenantes bacterium]
MNLAQSVRQRLLNLSRRTTEPFDLILTRYAFERLLYRISQSKWKTDFLLKGALLFSIWHDSPHRPTKDLDLMAYGNTNADYLKEVFQSLCNLKVENDGIEFLAESVICDEIREGNIYHGLRVKLMATLAGAKLRLQIDIGFGDVVVPEPENIIYPTLLEFPAPRLRAYSRYTMVAEKFHAMVSLGIVNSRMKDFYDLWIMAQQFDFTGPVFCKAIESTFKLQGTVIPPKVPLALTDFFSEDRVKKIQWNAFIRKSRFDMEEENLTIIIRVLRNFLMPPVSALVNKMDFKQFWPPGGPWK